MQAVAERLGWQVAGKNRRMVAERQRHLAIACLACGIGHVSRHVEGIIASRMFIVSVRHAYRHSYREHSVVIGHYGVAYNLLCGVSLTGCESPEHGRTTDYAYCHLGALHGHSGKCLGITLHADRVVSGIACLRLAHLHLECRSLIFLH